MEQLTRERDTALTRLQESEEAMEQKVAFARSEAADAAQTAVDEAREALDAAQAAASEAQAKATLEAEAAAGQSALHAHAVQVLESEKAALEERLAASEEGHRKDVSRLEDRGAEDREARARYEAESLTAQTNFQIESERLEAELETERERRKSLQGVHEREMLALKSALQKATGFKDSKPGSKGPSPTPGAAAAPSAASGFSRPSSTGKSR